MGDDVTQSGSIYVVEGDNTFVTPRLEQNRGCRVRQKGFLPVEGKF